MTKEDYENDFLNFDVDGYETESKTEEFVIDNDDKLIWAFKKLKASKTEAEKINEIANAQISKIESWKGQQLEKTDNSINYFTGLITAYYRNLLEENPKAKCVTPFGKASKRKVAAWKYPDDAALVELCKEYVPDAVVTKETVNKTELKKILKVSEGMVFTSDGEIIEGITVDENINITVTCE